MTQNYGVKSTKTGKSQEKKMSIWPFYKLVTGRRLFQVDLNDDISHKTITYLNFTIKNFVIHEITLEFDFARLE